MSHAKTFFFLIKRMRWSAVSASFMFLLTDFITKKVCFFFCARNKTTIQTALKELSPLSWNMTAGNSASENLKCRHILGGKIWQCVFPERSVFVATAPRPRPLLSASAGRMWSVLGGFVDGLTGSGVGVLWDGAHCFWKPGLQKTSAVVQKARSCAGIIRTGALQHLKVTFITSSCQDVPA